MKSLKGTFNQSAQATIGAPNSFSQPKPKSNNGILPSDKPKEQDGIKLIRPPVVRKRTAADRAKKDIALPKGARVKKRRGRRGSGGGEGGPA